MKLRELRLLPQFMLIPLLVVLALVVQAVIEWSIFNPAIEQLSALELRHKSVALDKLMDPNRPIDPSQRLPAFLDVLVKQGNEQVRVLEIHRIANANSVRIRKVGYQRAWMTGDILKTEMQVELSGSYPAIRQYLRELEVKDPATAIESMSFARPMAGNEVRGQIRFMLFSKQVAE